jgi:pyrrolysine biosynthesis protein PylC
LKITVVGGKLQGTEAAYLARQAGWPVVLIDKKPDVPARGLADEFYCLDVTGEAADLRSILRKTELVVPAFENAPALDLLKKVADEEGVPIAYDASSYEISSSKKNSDRLFAGLGIPAPRPGASGQFPLLAKPSGSSGSRGVRKIRNQEELESFLASGGSAAEDWLIQEYLEGPSYSLEIFGLDGAYVSLQPTVIEVDSRYDCKRVLAPADIPTDLEDEFDQVSRKIAAALNLKGIMDVEVILHEGRLKVLEIDARLPSQTPTAVFKSTGVNMVELLGDVFVRKSLSKLPPGPRKKEVIYEHIRVSPEAIEVSGEHIMSVAGPLRIQEGFFGADEAVTDFVPGKPKWAATMIYVEYGRREVRAKRDAVIESLRKHLGATLFRDPSPGDEQ